MRQEFSKAVKLAAWRRCSGNCESCTARLYPGKFEFHHDKECTFGGEGTIKNCLVLCVACHSAITKKRAAVIAKSDRVRANHLGIKKPRTMTRWRKFDGTIVTASRERN